MNWKYIKVIDDKTIGLPFQVPRPGTLSDQWNEVIAFCVLRCMDHPERWEEKITVYDPDGMGSGHFFSAGNIANMIGSNWWTPSSSKLARLREMRREAGEDQDGVMFFHHDGN